MVGENGAGKTTITKLLLGLYKNYSGEILINGVNIKDIQDFNKLFSVAFQDFAKYEITLRENIIFDKASVFDEEILKQMHELFFDIAKFEKGLDSGSVWPSPPCWRSRRACFFLTNPRPTST